MAWERYLISYTLVTYDYLGKNKIYEFDIIKKIKNNNIYKVFIFKKSLDFREKK